MVGWRGTAGVAVEGQSGVSVSGALWRASLWGRGCGVSSVVVDGKGGVVVAGAGGEDSWGGGVGEVGGGGVGGFRWSRKIDSVVQLRERGVVVVV